MNRSVKKTEKKVTTNQLADLIEKVAQGLSRFYDEFTEFKSEARENFARIDYRFNKIDERFIAVDESFGKVRSDIFDIKDNYATKVELQKVVVRIENLERNK